MQIYDAEFANRTDQSPSLENLDALRVVVVLLGAGGTASTSSGTRESLATALSVLLRSHGVRASGGGRRRLGYGGQSGSGGSRRSDRSSRGLYGGRRSRSGSLSGSRRRATSGSRTAPELGSNTGVAGGTAVDVEQDTRVGSLVGAGERHAGGKSDGSRSTDGDVDALHVELRTTLAVTLVQSEDLGAQDVFAGRESWELHLVLALLASVAAGEELVNSPGLAVEAVLGDLGPGEG
jgi:hypothetical protein